MSNETNLNAAQNNHIFTGKGGKMYKRISFMLAVALAVGLLGTTIPARAQLVRVPDLVGMLHNDALDAIRAAGLEIGGIGSRVNSAPRREVISQDPSAGTLVPAGSKVSFVTSCGWTVVPDVVGMSDDDAGWELHDALLFPRNSREYNHSIPIDFVITQDPAGGTSVLACTFVYLTISKGPPPKVEVPDVVGMSESDAESAINSAELSVGSIGYLYSDTIPNGCVISTYPRAGTVVDAGTEVDLDISLGPDTGGPTVDVPDVVGMAESDAKSVITSAGLSVGTISNDYSDSVPKGLVISQSPSGGTSVSEGYSVLLTISLGPEPDDGPPASPDESCLAAHWKLDDGSGNTAIDSSGNGFDITLHNTTWEDGVFGGAVNFHGAGYGDVWDFNYSDNAITLCAWVWHDGFRLGEIERYVTVGPFVAVIRKEYDGRLHFYIGTDGNLRHLWVDDVLTEGQWHHVAGTWDGLDQRLYIDGVEIASQTPGGVLGRASYVMISSGEEPLNGMLDDVRIYNCALSADDILRLLDTQPIECIVAYWKLDERAGPIAYDSIGDYHCTVIDGAGGSPSHDRGIHGQAIGFYGDGDHVLNEAFGSRINGLDALTVALWVKSDLTNTDKGFIIFEDPVGNDDRDMRYDMLGDNGGGVNLINVGISSDNPNNNGRQQLESSSNVQTTEWQHLTMTWRSGQQLKLYINGVLDTPTSNEPGLVGFLTGNAKLIIGKGGKDVGDASWQGLIDDVRIYDCALDENQIKSLMSALPAPVTPAPAPLSDPLSEALDTSLSFTTGGGSDWFSQTKTSYHDGDAAQSGNISDDQESWMQTTVNGKGTVKFYWKVSSEEEYDCLEFHIDGVLQEKISGLGYYWQQKTYTINTSGSHVLEWRYMKDGATSFGDDCGWVDKVEWVTTP